MFLDQIKVRIMKMTEISNTKLSPPRPLSIKLISFGFLFGGVSRCLNLATAAFPLGIYFSPGLPVFIYNLLIGVTFVFSGIGLWRLQEEMRRLAIGLLCWTTLNTILMYAVPSNYAKMLNWMSQSLGTLPAPVFESMTFRIGAIVGAVIITAVQIWFLGKWGSLFVKSATSSQQT